MRLVGKRKTDELGRIVLPAEARSKLSIGEKEECSIFLSDDAIIIKKQAPRCVLCASAESVNRELQLCQACIERVKAQG